MSELSGLARKRVIWSLRRRRGRLSLSEKRPLFYSYCMVMPAPSGVVYSWMNSRLFLVI